MTTYKACDKDHSLGEDPNELTCDCHVQGLVEVTVGASGRASEGGGGGGGRRWATAPVVGMARTTMPLFLGLPAPLNSPRPTYLGGMWPTVAGSLPLSTLHTTHSNPTHADCGRGGGHHQQHAEQGGQGGAAAALPRFSKDQDAEGHDVRRVQVQEGPLRAAGPVELLRAVPKDGDPLHYRGHAHDELRPLPQKGE